MLRPGDANEVVEAYRYVMQLRHEPAVLALSRQPLPTLDRTQVRAGRRRRARRLCAGRSAGRQARDHPHRHRAARSASPSRRTKSCSPQGIRSRVVSMPSWDIFEHQPQEYRDSVLPPDVTARRRDRAGLDVRLGALCRRDGPRHRHEDLRRLGAAQGAAAQVRLRARLRRRRGEGARSAGE